MDTNNLIQYKLAPGSKANRIKHILGTLISNSQTGFVKGRFIGENTRLIYDILNNTEQYKVPGLLVLIDFVKALDTITIQEKWNQLYNDVSLQWKSIYKTTFSLTRATYIQWFQTRILHQILGTNTLLFKMNIVNNKMCTF